MFSYKKFEELCKEREVVPYQVAKATGILTSTFSEWKNKAYGRKSTGYTPKAEKIKLVADYFGVPLDYFMED